MHALRLTGWQQDPTFEEMPEPDPGPGQVVVRVGAAGACHSDLHLAYEFPPGALPFEPPFTLGHEIAGWVEALGPGVRGPEPGTPVAVYGSWGCGRCHACRLGAENLCSRAAEDRILAPGLGRDGGMAPFVLIDDPRHLVEIGELDPVDAAPLTDAALTPYHAIRRSLPLLVPGSAALVIGIGGLGHLAVQLLDVLAPCTVIAVDSRESARAEATLVGARHAFAPGPDAAEQVRDATGGRGVEVALDLVGSTDSLALALSVVRPGGHVTLVGLGGGSAAFSFFSQPYDVSLAATYWGTLPELLEVVALAREGRIRARTHVAALSDALDLYGTLRAGGIDGRGVVVPTHQDR